MTEQESAVTVKFANPPKLFGKWDYDEVQVTDQCFKDYIAV
jgi:small subunit ribosomal protein S5e